VYILFFNKNFSHLNYSLYKKFKIIGSAHNIKEIRIKEVQKMENIFLSSLFKRNKNYIGLNKFKLLSKLTKKKIIALGGISQQNIKSLRLLNNPDFAGISFFE
jgi:Thiamine monophosphate synthase